MGSVSFSVFAPVEGAESGHIRQKEKKWKFLVRIHLDLPLDPSGSATCWTQDKA